MYADQTLVVGPLATFAEPHTYDLCRDHAERLTGPRGWEVVRVAGEYSEPALDSDDLEALANAVREVASSKRVAPGSRQGAATGPRGSGQGAPGQAVPATPQAEDTSPGARRGHLRAIRD